MADYTLSAKITGDSSSFEKAFSTAQRSVASFEAKTAVLTGKLDKIGGSLMKFGAVATLGITTPLIAAGKGAVTAASDFEENLNKVDVAFGNSSQSVKEWANNAKAQFGLSKKQALEMTSLFGDMATSMGLTKPAAANMSTSLAGLAGDLASFKNVSIDQAMTALNGVFTGETESLKQLGIVMTETNLEEFASKTGQVYKEMSQAEKVQLRYNYVMAMGQNAAGDYARTSDGTANSLRTFQASIDDLAVALGQHLLPAVTPIIQDMTKMVNKFAELSPKTQQTIIKLGLFAAALGPIFTVAGGVVKGVSGIIKGIGKMNGVMGKTKAVAGKIVKFLPQLAKFGGVIGAAAAILISAWKNSEKFRESVGDLVKVVGKSLNSAFEALKPVINTAMDLFGDLGKAIGDAFSVVIEMATPVIKTVADTVTKVISIVNPIVSFVAGVVSKIVSTISTIIGKVTAIFNTVYTTVKNTWDEIKSAVSSVVSSIKNAVSAMGSAINKVWAGIKTTAINAVNKIKNGASTIITPFKNAFNTVKETATSVFGKIKSAWKGFKGFVSGLFSGVGDAVSNVVSKVKRAVNSIIGKINGAIKIINKIPGVSISRIPKLLHGTKNWQGGFAVMNEGGRGELVNLPNGSQVIPHDISVKYAKEAARTNSHAEPFDVHALGQYIIAAVTAQGGQIATGLEKGIGGMRMVADDREVARYISGLGFARG